MKTEKTPAGGKSLKELRQVAGQLFDAVSDNDGAPVAQRFADLAKERPEYMSSLARSMQGSANYPVRALVANGLLISMTELTDGTPPDQTTFQQLAQMARTFTNMYMPVATQRPDLALAITRAALDEPAMPVSVRDHVTTAFANASFALLRSRPQETTELLQTMVHRANDPTGAAYMSGPARTKVADHLATVSDLYPAHYGDKATVAISGGTISIPADVALAVVEAVQQLSPSPLLQKKMQSRGQEIQRRKQKLENT